MNMQKKVLSLCIALALGNNAFAAPEVEHKAKIEDKTCPAKGTVLTKEQKAKLPKKCLPAEEETTWEWIAGGAAAAVAGIVAIASGSGGGGGDGSSHHSDPTPDPVPDPVPDPTPDPIPNPDPIPDPVPDPIPDPVPDPAHETVSYANGALLDKTAKTLQINGVTYSYSLDGDRYALTAPDGTVLYTNSANWSVDANNDLLIKGKDAAGLYWSYDAAGKFTHADANTKVVEGDGTNTKIDTGSSASGQGSAGTIVDGDGTTTEISGGTSAKDGGTGTKVDGNDAVVDNKGDTTASGEGSTGTDITGDGGKVINGGDSAITDGGTGTKIDGKDAQVDNKGDSTISGEGSTGTEIKGDDAVINNGGKTDITEGGTGTKVDGNGADVINTGDTSASGSGSTGTDITGDGATVDNTGKTDVTDGGTGTKIDGKDAQVDNKGDSTISGEGSTGTEIKGDDAKINNDGKTDITEGGTGTKIDGNGADVINTGDTSASGSGSTVTDITGDGAVVDNTGKKDITDGGTGTKIDGKDAQVDNKGDSTISGGGSTGTEIKGDDATINNNGKTDVTGGGTGTKVDGNGADVINTGDTSASGSGSTGTVITGDGAVIDNTGKTDVADGGTGTKVDGNDAKIDNKGDSTAKGADSVVIDVTGDSAVINNTGKTEVTDGGTGTKIDGKDAKVDNQGDTTATGTGSAGTVITGDNAQVNTQGDTTVANGATGTKVDGNNAAVTIKGDGTEPAKIDVTGGGKGVVVNGNDAKITIEDATANVDGTGSSLATITGDNATATIAGDIYVKNAAHGVDVAGDNATVNTAAKIFVQDLNSIGINITAINDGADEKTTFTNTGDINVTNNATGAIIGGDKADVTLDGNVNVTFVKNSSGQLQLGNGVLVNGNNSNVHLQGNVTLANEELAFSTEKTAQRNGSAYGVSITGSNNNVDIGGSIGVSSIGNIGNAYGTGAFTGLTVTGAGNEVNVTGGINAEVDDLGTDNGYTPTVRGLIVDGANSVSISGKSSLINNSDWIQFGILVDAKKGANILFTSDSKTDISFATQDGDAYQRASAIKATGVGTKIENAGLLTSTSNGGMIMQSIDGASVVNSGTIKWTSNGTGIATQGAQINATNNSTASNTGTIELKNYVNPKSIGADDLFPVGSYGNTMYGVLATNSNSSVNNDGTIVMQGAGLYGLGASQTTTQALNNGSINLDGFGPGEDVNGNAINKTVYTVADNISFNRGAGMVAGSTRSGSSTNVSATNKGNITVNNSGFGMLALNGGTATNQGTITLTADAATVSDGSNAQLVGLGAMNGGKAINDTSGVININTDIGRAFYTDGKSGSQIVNKGTVNYMGSAIDNSNVHMGSTPQSQVTGSPVLLKGYSVGTNADGSAGKFYGSNVDVSGVTVDTGFTEGSAAKSETFDDVFQGNDIHGAESIQSDSVVWSAEGKTDASGNVDVTMTKKAYTDVVTDTSVNSVAGALEAGYTNNALYQSLNLKTAKDVTNAMKQLSGSKATSAFNDAKVLSNRFTMLADSAIETSSGLGFNVVAKGDKRAELGNNTQYDMMALSQKLSLTDSQTLKLQYGIARLDGNGDVKTAGDNGLTGGYSQFFGLEHQMDLGDNMSWDNALRYDNHQLDSSRSIQYGSVNEVANSKNTQQYMELKSQFSKGFALSDTLNFKPSVGAKVRHTRDGSVNETGANDYNLKMDAGSETAVDAIAGMELTYAGKNGWAATASVEGGPNLSYSKSARSASLQGAAGQRFSVDDGQKGGGVNSLAQVGVSYNQGNASLSMDAYNWQEDSVSDKGMTMNFKLTFK